ncbi:hypothetical protein CVT26_006141 [Gymnopilus dilepis]|uniref:Uncharacterized protein n=1 Tax=Gymnopilus dilepis TaxID=231916 RepID=A0A409WG68_9AGAR|nr:hypothetical protein CVT26_006141 [Gymnopilus dilepis]
MAHYDLRSTPVVTPNPKFNLASLLQQGFRDTDASDDVPIGDSANGDEEASIDSRKVECEAPGDNLASQGPSCASFPVGIHAAGPTSPLEHLSQSDPGCAGKAHKRSKNHRNRQQKRDRTRQENFSDYRTRPNIQKNHVDSAEVVQTNLVTENCSAAKAAFVGRNDKSGRKKPYELEDFLGEKAKLKFGYVPWNGMSRKNVTDSQGRRVAILAGQPRDEDWPLLMKEAAEALECRRPRLDLAKGDRVHRRGAFPAIPCGISHGGGSMAPSNLHNNKANATVVQELSDLPCFKRLAGFASSVMASQAPKLYQYYVEHLAELHSRHPHLKHLFSSSVFAAASYNFGPRTTCFKHKDFANLPFGLCAVTALGSFDPKRGGHLILWELELVIEFPPGATILLPSAIIAHSNIPVQSNETRYSFAQYTAGSLFRWVEHGCQLDDDFYASLTQEELEAEQRKDDERWSHGLSMFEVGSNAL